MNHIEDQGVYGKTKDKGLLPKGIPDHALIVQADLAMNSPGNATPLKPWQATGLWTGEELKQKLLDSYIKRERVNEWRLNHSLDNLNEDEWHLIREWAGSEGVNVKHLDRVRYRDRQYDHVMELEENFKRDCRPITWVFVVLRLYKQPALVWEKMADIMKSFG